jgi:hypothetical protein
MSATLNSIKIFGLYLILIPGSGLMLMPDLILNMFGLSHGPELWIPRLVGLLAAIIGVFDLLIARHKVEQFIPWTIRLRYAAAAFMIGLWALGQVEAGILLFAAIDAGGATWTALSFKKPQVA